MSQVWKFPLLPGRKGQYLTMPYNAVPLSLQYQGDTLTLWVLVEPYEANVSTCVDVIGTGWDYDAAGMVYAGTAQDSSTGLVWHAFMTKPSV